MVGVAWYTCTYFTLYAGDSGGIDCTAFGTESLTAQGPSGPIDENQTAWSQA